MDTFEPPEGKALKCEAKAVSDLRSSLAAAREEGKDSGKLHVIFNVAQFLASLVEEIGYKVVLVRLDGGSILIDSTETTFVEHDIPPGPAPTKARKKAPAKKTAARNRKASSPDTPLTTLHGIKPALLSALEADGRRNIGQVIGMDDKYLLAFENVGPTALKSLDAALKAAGHTRKQQ